MNSVSTECCADLCLATPSNTEISFTDHCRPNDVQLPRIKTLLEVVLPFLDDRHSTCNEKALARIVTVRTTKGQRHITRIRLLKMQEEFSCIDSFPSPATSEIQVRRNA